MTVIEDQQPGHRLGADDLHAESVTARDAVREMIDAGLPDRVTARVDAGGLALTGD